jgi:hypothetical protein
MADRRRSKAEAAAALKVDEVKTALEHSETKTDATLGKIHTLVNHDRGVTLKALAAALRIIATDRPTRKNKIAAAAAEAASREHEGQQAVVDEANGKA